MKLQRKWYTFLFASLFVLSLIFLSVSAVQTGLILANGQIISFFIFSASLVVFLIISFFIKESNFLDIINKNNTILNVIEIIILGVVFCLTIFLNQNLYLQAIYICIQSVLIYFCARISTTRLAAISAYILSVLMFSVFVNNINSLEGFIINYGLLILYFITTLFIKYKLKENRMHALWLIILGVLYALASIYSPIFILLFLAACIAMLSGYHGIRRNIIMITSTSLTIVATQLVYTLINHLNFNNTDLYNKFWSPTFNNMDNLLSFNKNIRTLYDYFDNVVLKGGYMATQFFSSYQSFIIPIILIFLCMVGVIYLCIRKQSYLYFTMYFTTISFIAYFIFFRISSEFLFVYLLLPIIGGYGIDSLLLKKQEEVPLSNEQEEIENDSEEKDIVGIEEIPEEKIEPVDLMEESIEEKVLEDQEILEDNDTPYEPDLDSIISLINKIKKQVTEESEPEVEPEIVLEPEPEEVVSEPEVILFDHLLDDIGLEKADLQSIQAEEEQENSFINEPEEFNVTADEILQVLHIDDGISEVTNIEEDSVKEEMKENEKLQAEVIHEINVVKRKVGIAYRSYISMPIILK